MKILITGADMKNDDVEYVNHGLKSIRGRITVEFTSSGDMTEFMKGDQVDTKKLFNYIATNLPKSI